MKRPSVLIALLAVGSATCALAQNPPPPDDETAPSAASSPHQRDATSTNAAEAPTPSAKPSSAATPHQRQVTDGSKTSKAVTPESFASQAAIIGKAEIELGQIALKNTQDEGVRKYAERMVKDHGAADKKLKAIAAKEIQQLPQSLSDALGVMESSELVRDALGEHIFEWFLRNKRSEWMDYKAQVTPFELERYLPSW